MIYTSIYNMTATAIMLGLLAGCTVGPDFKRPATPEVAVYTASPLPTRTVATATLLGEPQHFVTGDSISSQWWHEFGSARLAALIEEALQTSPVLAAEQARLRQAQEVYAARSGSTLYPQVDANFSGQRQRFNPGALGQSGETREFSLYNAGMGVRYNFDLAGSNRRALEALAARSDYQHFQLAGARLTLAANIVTTAMTQAKLSLQLATAKDILHSQTEQLELTRQRVRLGQAAPDDMLALQTQLEQTRAGIPLRRSQLQQNDHLLAVLVGRAPGMGGLPEFTLEDFVLPSDLPLLVPSELARARPDILGAEALLHTANAEYGVAIARLYPQLNLSADLGSQALTTGALFGGGSTVWSLVGQLTQPLFNPGLPAEKRAALAAFDAAAANYQTVVLESLRDVADVLSALRNDAKRLAALSAADVAAEQSLQSVQRRYALGTLSYYDLLIAHQQRQQTRLELIEGQANRLINSVAFYQAMGGGYAEDRKTTSVNLDKRQGL